MDLGLQWAGEEWVDKSAPAPSGELWKSPRLGVDILSLLSLCLGSALLLVRLCDSLSEETVDEDVDEEDWLLVPDDRELRLLLSLCALRSSLRFSRSSFLCLETSAAVDGICFSPAIGSWRFPSSRVSSFPSEVVGFLSGDWNTEGVEELGLSGTELVVLPSMTSSWEALALSHASAFEERAFLIGCGFLCWLAATAALPLPDP